MISDDPETQAGIELTVLAYVSDDSELVKVTASTFSSERLLERDLHVGDVVLVPA